MIEQKIYTNDEVLKWVSKTMNEPIDRIKVIGEFISKLTPKEFKIFSMRHNEHKTFEEVGKEFGVTRERIRQIDAKIMEKARQYLSSN